MRRSRSWAQCRNEVDSVLAGRTAPSVEELLDLVHDVNPTGRGLPPSEEARRYALKSRLQSLLIRRHLDALAFVEEAPDVVRIDYRYGPHDGCHAVLGELDDDVRGIVRLALDTSAGDGPTPSATTARTAPRRSSPAAPGGGSADLMAQARAALEEYDFDLGRELLVQAFEVGGAAVEPTLALFEFLVDTVGDDGEVLQRSRELPRDTASDPRARALVALAGARAGQASIARQWLRGATGAPVALALARLAERCLTEGDLDGARRDLTSLRELDGTHVELPGLSARLDDAVATRRQPLEAQALRALEAGAFDEALALATSLAEAFPESGVARSVQRRVQEHRREETRADLLARAESASSKEDYASVVALLRRAQHLSADPEVERRLAEAQGQAARREDEVRAGDVVALLDAGDEAAALHAYAALADRPRAAVRAARPQARLQWVEDARLPERPNRLRDGLAAVVAMEEAERLLSAGGDPHHVLAELERVEPFMGGVRAWRDLTGRARTRATEVDRAFVEERLRAATDALDADCLREARATLEQADGRTQDEHLRSEIARLRAAVQRAEDVARLVARLEEEVAASEPVTARATARKLVTATTGAARDRWEARERALAAQARDDLRFEELDGAGLRLVDLDVDIDSVAEHPGIALTADGRLALVGCARGGWVFLYEIDLHGQTVQRALSFRAPWPMNHAIVTATDDEVWVTGEDCEVIELERRSGDVVRAVSLKRWLPAGARGGSVLVVPRTACAWIALEDCDTLSGQRIVDLDELRLRRDRPELETVDVIPGPGAPIIVAREALDDLVLLTQDGRDPTRLPHAGELVPLSVAHHPSGKGWVVLVAHPDADEMEEDEPFSHMATDGRLVNGVYQIVGSVAGGPTHVAVAADSGLELALVSPPGGDTCLVAFRWDKGAPVEAYRARAPSGRLIQDRQGRHAAFIAATSTGLVAVPVGREAPRFGDPETLEPRYGRTPQVQGHQFCGYPSGAVNAQSLALFAYLRQESQEVRQRRVEIELTRGGDEDALCALAYALDRCNEDALTRQVVAALRERHPDAPGARLLSAASASEEGRWSEVRRLLADVDAAALDVSRQVHALHLLGLAHLHLGDAGSARRVLQEVGALDDGACDVEGLLILAAAFQGDEQPQGSLSRLVSAIRRADACLGRGDGAGAVAALHQPFTWWHQEVQSLARLAAAYLSIEPASAVERHRKRFALASFCAVTRRGLLANANFPLGEATYGDDRVTELLTQAARWLEDPT